MTHQEMSGQDTGPREMGAIRSVKVRDLCKRREKTALRKGSLESSKRHRLNRQTKLGGKREHI